MKTIKLAKVCAGLSGTPARTCLSKINALQAGRLVRPGSRGRHGGAEMTTACKINALLGCVLHHPRAVPLAVSVRKVRKLNLRAARRTHRGANIVEQGNRGAFSFVRDLSIDAVDRLGTTLELILDDVQSGALERWAGSEHVSISLDVVDGRTSATLVISRGEFGAFFAFGADEAHRPHSTGVERFVRIYKKAFERLTDDDMR